MVTAASGIRTLAEVDRPSVRVVGIANTTTMRAAGRSLVNTVPIAVTSIDDAVAMLRAGQADVHSDVIRCRRSSRNSPARTSSMEDFSRPASRSRCRRVTRKLLPM